MLAVLLLLVASMLAPGINYATPNQSISENFTNTTNVSEIVENTTNSTTIQNTTTAVVNDTVISQQENQTSDTSNNTQNSSSDNSNQTDTIQNNSAAASDGTYTNVHGIWLNVDDVNNVNVNELLTAGITDVFVKANRISNPTYQSVLTTIINKLQGTEIRIHAWITCFVDANGDWVDPKDSETTDALVNAITDITTNYNIAGIHLDYVRYPGTAYQYSGGTEAITSFVQRVYTTVKSIKAKVAVSAALMPEGAANAYYYGQDYEQLSNYLDFLVPMVYEGNYKEDNDWITSATAYIVNHSTKPVVVGLQTYKSDSNLVALSAEEVKADIESALSGGASGFALFRYGWLDKDFFQTANSNNTTSTTQFTTAQIAKAANDVKLFIEGNKYLPTWITVAGVLVNQGQFMYLLSEATLHIQNGDGSAISLVDCTVPSVSGESLSGGTLSLSAYVKLANEIACFVDGNHQAPSLCKSSLGLQSYQSVIYMYSRILSNYLTDGSLQSSVVVKAWSPSNLPVKDSNTFTVAEIAKAANDVKLFVEGNKYLPTWITVGGVTVNQGQFLYLLTTCTSQLNSGITSLIALPSVSVASSPLEQMTSGNLDKTEYVDLANRVKSFMDSNGIAPNYGSTSLGKLRFESLLYLYSRVVAFYGQNQYLPNYATMKSWSSVVATEPSVPAELQQYLQATTKCEVNDPRIIALAQSITSGATSSYQKATLIFNWVRDNINYSYYYDSQKGAVGTLTSGSANCCDHSHLVVALSRAAGLPARYVHGYCYFTSSGNWYGHVFAQIYVNGQWYNADATSSRNTLGVINNWNTNTWTYKGTYASLPF
ncbi:MAG: hypothetical protein ISP06_00245 [Methanobacterium formicicum]|uniref:Transglutaminase-like domain-containing protein n=1 Tax=Methanobacterium formicicum TaxID=2162 RepID=A0A843AIW6_METFO|nr:hypothetical protein [Methanobacterium formicicum]